MEPDPDPGGPKTCGTCGSRSPTPVPRSTSIHYSPEVFSRTVHGCTVYTLSLLQKKRELQSRESPLHSTSISGLWNFFLRGPDSRGQIHRPGLGGDSGIGLSYWPASLCSPVPGRYDNSILESIISPSQGLRIWLEIGINDDMASDQRRAFIF
jgi:hypothetical protein